MALVFRKQCNVPYFLHTHAAARTPKQEGSGLDANLPEASTSGTSPLGLLARGGPASYRQLGLRCGRYAEALTELKAR